MTYPKLSLKTMKWIGFLSFIALLWVGCDTDNSPNPILRAITLKTKEGGKLTDTLKINAFDVQTIIVAPDSLSAATLNSDNEKIKWQVEPKGIAELQSSPNGWVVGVRGIKDGVTTLTAMAQGSNIQASIKVQVSYTPLEAIRLSPSSVTLLAGYQAQVGLVYTPQNASNKEVTWSSDNEAVATAYKGVISAKALGRAIIVVTGSKGKKDSVAVQVVTCDEIKPSEGNASYCSASGSGAYNLNKLATSNAEKNINYEDDNPSDQSYEHITTQAIIAQKGKRFMIQATHSNTWSKSLVWIDWNGDNDFDDVGEFVAQLGKSGARNPTFPLTHEVRIFPCAKPGVKRMRIRTLDAWSNDGRACGNVRNSSVKDFNLEIK